MEVLILGISGAVSLGLWTTIFFKVGRMEGKLKSLNGYMGDLDRLHKGCPIFRDPQAQTDQHLSSQEQRD